MSEKNTIPEPPKDFPPMNQWNFVYEKAYQWLSLLDFKNIPSLRLYTHFTLIEYLKKKNFEKFDHLEIEATGNNGLYNFNDSEPCYREVFEKDLLFFLQINLTHEVDERVDLIIYFYIDNKAEIGCVGPKDNEWNKVINQKFHKILDKNITWEDGFFFLKKLYEETIVSI